MLTIGIGIGIPFDLRPLVAAVVNVVNVFAGTAAAYPLRIPAGSTYTGPLLRARRSTDNAEQDIGATASADAGGNRWLDSTSLISWATTQWTGAVPGAPLDVLTGAVACSLRKVRTAYAGLAIRVRRSSDNAEQDIGFSGGVLDTASLLTFVGAASGFVRTWYDQSGNGRDLAQATAAAQPRIVNAGVLDTVNSKPAIVFSGAQWLDGTTEINLAAPVCWGIVSNSTGTGQRRILDTVTSTVRQFIDTDSAVTGYRFFAGTTVNASAGSYVSAENVVLSAQFDGAASSSLRKNGVQVAAGNAGSAGIAQIRLGRATATGAAYLTGSISEVIAIQSNLTAESRTMLERSQANYHGITYTHTASAFVATWYDQSGNGRHATQATTTAQPRIVNAGVLEALSGRPALWFDGVNDNLIHQPTTLLETNPQAISAVVSLQGVGSNSIVSNDQAGQFGHGFGNADAGGLPQIMFNSGWAAGSTAWPLNSAQVATASWSTDNVELYLQGTRVASSGAREDINALNAGDYLIIGSAQPTALYSPAKLVGEVVVVNASWSGRPAAQAVLEQSQGTAYGVTVA